MPLESSEISVCARAWHSSVCAHADQRASQCGTCAQSYSACGLESVRACWVDATRVCRGVIRACECRLQGEVMSRLSFVHALKLVGMCGLTWGLAAPGCAGETKKDDDKPVEVS